MIYTKDNIVGIIFSCGKPTIGYHIYHILSVNESENRVYLECKQYGKEESWKSTSDILDGTLLWLDSGTYHILGQTLSYEIY